MDFPETIEAQLSGQTLRRATLVWFDFASQPMGIWNGFGKLVTADDREWGGIAGMGSVEGLEQAIDGSAPELRFTVSGVDETFAAKVKGEAPEYLNRAVTVFSQFMGEDWQLLDQPFAISWALMHSMIARKQAGEGGFVRTVTITAETLFAGKKRPKFSYLTDRDQQLRHPGDRFAERTAGIESKLIRFPQF